MIPASLRRLLPNAPPALLDMLDGAAAPLEPPIRSEIFGPQRFAQHGRSLGETHRAAGLRLRPGNFFPRLHSNMAALRAANRYIGVQAATGYDLSPAAEWLLDNFHLVEAQFKEIHEGMPGSYFRALPVLQDGPLAGLPRVYGVAWAFVAHTDGAFDEGLLTRFLCAYQETCELKLSEMWALPTTLRVVLIENLRRLAERVATNKAAREVANLCCDHLDTLRTRTLRQVLALLDRRGVGRVFLAQMAQRLQHAGAGGDSHRPARHQEWLRVTLPDLGAVQMQQAADQAADNLSVSNAVTSLRAIGDADWPDIVARTSSLMRLMVTSSVFHDEDVTTRDQTLHHLEKLARRCGRSEVSVAQTLLALMQAAPAGDSILRVASHWLQGNGRPALMAALGIREPLSEAWRSARRKLAMPAYLSTIAAGTAALVTWVLWHRSIDGPGASEAIGLTLAGVALMLMPASEAVVALINRLISESARPRHLPRLALAGGIPTDHRVMVVIPAMLTHASAVTELAHRLRLHHLANPEPNTQFALLTDWVDADTPHLASDEALLAGAVGAIEELNRLYPAPAAEPPRFLVLHRARQFSETEQRWIGWERKRGKLEQLVAAMDQGCSTAFLDLGAVSRIAPATRYIVTLDSDTRMPPARLRELVGVAAHPQNQPRLDPLGRIVVSGYGILQPRVATPLPSADEFTLYHGLFAGQCGVDPYSAASSEVYQDLFGEGSFTGKGLLHVGAVHAVLAGRLPEGQVLSHDLFEGSMARCGAVTDIALIEDAPFHADVAASRVHRWIRGDWQLLPLLLNPGRYPVLGINRWKMLDNLRRSLVAPASLALLLLALSGHVVSPWAALALVTAAFSGGPLIGALAGFLSSRNHLARRHFYRDAGTDLARAALGGLWLLGQLLQQALRAVDAIVRALYRTLVSRRHLLQWTTAATAQAMASTGLAGAARTHWSLPVVGLLLLAALMALETPHPALATALCLLWAASPVWTWFVSRPGAAREQAALPPPVQAHLEGIARDTWRFFERCVVADDNHLPPDNLQVLPLEAVAHRTSPTNIGLYLLSVSCARQFGWIGTEDLLERMDATLATLARLQRHRGHFLNWYDTRTCAPLLPMYVSTVDSGNLTGHLLAVAQACLELARTPHDSGPARRAIAASTQRLAGRPVAEALHRPDGPIARLLALTDPLATCEQDVEGFGRLLAQALQAFAALAPPDAATPAHALPTAAHEASWLLGDHLHTLHSAWRDAQARLPQAGANRPATERLRALAEAFEALAWQADFGFLHDARRHLLHIGYRVAEQQLDAGFYDLLASESRLTSLLAIARGDVPVRHWSSLGRLYLVSGADVGLRSWSGSMFEYLMPGLILAEPRGSLLHEAGRAALREQIRFARSLDVPWGISESAYAGRDHTLAYQYAPQGVPRLALRRTPPDELVVAPYATALAAQIDAAGASANFAALEQLGARARYGFAEALDFTAARQTGAERFTVVGTFMAHHHGMSIVALANVLLDAAAQRWGMANAPIEAVASLLHERAPREVSMLYATPAAAAQPPPQRRDPGRLLREVPPGSAAVEPTLVLSNGRYNVSLRPNGAGWSRWGEIGINRWRDDGLRDAHGSFFYLRRSPQQRPVSVTLHPAPDPAAHYQCTFHADRACFDATWPDVQARTTVWVSPEDDIEFRQVELSNPGDDDIEIELISAFEIALADARADEAHPAFGNLFVQARWQADHQALVFARTPRLATERATRVAHFLAESDSPLVSISAQADRQVWLGRNQDVSQPRAAFPAQAPHAAQADDAGGDRPLETGLDPVCALVLRLRIARRSNVRLTFATAAADDADTLHAVIDKYHQPSHIQRASLMSATLSGIRLRDLGINPPNFAAVQALTTPLLLSLTRPAPGPVGAVHGPGGVCDRRLLWRFGIPGDRPIILVSVTTAQGMGLLRALAAALGLWAWGRVACDLVVVHAEPASYYMALERDITALRERHVTAHGVQPGPVGIGFHVLRASEVPPDEWSTLLALARVHLDADGRPLAHHVQAWIEQHERAFELRHERSTTAVPVSAWSPDQATPPSGQFDGSSGAFQFEAGAGVRPNRPWINVLSNPAFGAQISESGGGYTWAINSRLNQLTAWSNDPVADPPSEWFLLQDRRSQEVWSVAPSAWGDERVRYSITHGQGHTTIRHDRGSLEVTATWCVDASRRVKQVALRLVNHGSRTRHLRAIGIVEWMMGASRTDRNTVRTSLYRQRLPAVADAATGSDAVRSRKLTALLATQRDRAGGFGGGSAFLALAGGAEESEDWTCDRRECFDARGRLVLPDHFGQASGDGLDPCAALSGHIVLPAGDTIERVFLLGHADTAEAARRLAAEAAATPPAQRLDAVHTYWNALLGATEVKTPDPLFDAMVNRWLLYQAVSCRMWAKAGFYQAGGATGYRDQLQDAMALAWAAPAMLRQHIVLCASRQYVEGDVQHWWHAPLGAGVRTRFTDDLLWLAHACVHYLQATGDATVLDVQTSFLEGPALPPGAEDSYGIPATSAQFASVYEHAARAIDRSLAVGSHGLPLMGGGDWNDGMNRVGIEGRGESVWLGWFLCRLVVDFAPLARQRDDRSRAQRWEAAARGWTAALNGTAWDGQWFKRAYFDNGQPLGSHANAEARIDLIAQAWSVLSGAAYPELATAAMAAVETHLSDPVAGLTQLLAPAFTSTATGPSAGYIQAYPPGVRENGSQYAHAALWALMAQARLACQQPGPPASRDRPYRSFTWLSPAHRAVHPDQSAAYGLEPYAMAGDICSQPPYVGRGGWSWYTGAAAWMHRAAIESIFGLRQSARELCFMPCLPSHWQRAELTLRRDDRTMRFILMRSSPAEAAKATSSLGAQLLAPGQSLHWTTLAPESCFVMPLPMV